MWKLCTRREIENKQSELKVRGNLYENIRLEIGTLVDTSLHFSLIINESSTSVYTNIAFIAGKKLVNSYKFMKI